MNQDKDREFYNYAKGLESILRRIKESEILSQTKKDIILRYFTAVQNEGLSQARIIRILEQTKKVGEWLKTEFDKATRQDIEEMVSFIHSNPNWSYYTIASYKITIKRFYKWFLGDNEEYPVIVKWIKIGDANSRRKKKLPTELITEEDVQNILKACKNPRDRALISLLWESGARIGELATAQIKSLSFRETEAELVIHGKTGYRKILLLSSVPYLKKWLEYHPKPQDKEMPLFTLLEVKRLEKGITYPCIAKTLRTAMKKAGVNKPNNPHLWRHSRATFLANYLTEAQLCSVLGWVQGSKEAGTYVHLSGRETNEKIRQINGIETSKEEKFKSVLTPIVCPICNETNEPNSITCLRCSNPLTLAGALEKKNRFQEMEQRLSAVEYVFEKLTKSDENIEAKLDALISKAEAQKILAITKTGR